MKQNTNVNFNISFGPKQSHITSQIAYKETPESNISFQSDELLSQYKENSPKTFQRKRIVFQNSLNTLDKQNVLTQTLRPKAITQQFLKFQKVMKTMSLVQRFKSNLFINSYILPTNSQQDFYKQEKYTNSTQQNEFKKNNETDSNKYLIQPSSSLSQCFDMISLCIQLLTLWLVSFIVIFTHIDKTQASLVLFIIIFLILELCLTLNKAVIIQGQIVKDRRLIFQNWLKKSSFPYMIELVVCIYISINHSYMYQNNPFILLIQIIAIISRILQQYDNMMETLYQLSIASDLLDLITLIISIYFFAHFIACFWLFFGLEQQNEGSWITYYELQNQSIWIQYSTSFYWATMTMVTVGYGDITPKNQYEMIFCDVAMFLSSCVFAYSMNSIGIILKNINDQKVNYKKRAIILNEYMKQNDIANHIQDKVRNYLRHEIHSEYNSIQEEALKIIKELPKGLEQEILNNINSRILKKIKLLEFFSKWTKQQLIDKIELCNYTPKEYIYHQDSNQNLDLFFIYKGSVDICEEQSQHNIYSVKEGEIFGEYSFITGCNTKTCAISNGFSQIAKIKREQFLKIIQEVHKDYEKLHHIKDKILLYNDYSDLMVSCKFCKKTTHSFYTCPMLTYSPDIEQRIKKNQLYYYEQERYQCDRSVANKKNSLINQKEILDNIKEYQEINGIDQNEDFNQSEVKTESDNEDPYYYNQEMQTSMKNIGNIPKMINRYSKISLNNHFRIRQSIVLNQQTSIKKGNSNGGNNINIIPLSGSLNHPKTDVQTKQGSKNMLEIFQEQLQFHNCDIDRIQEYEEYMKHNNFKSVAKDIHQRPKFPRQQLKASKYTYNYQAKMLIIKMREYYDEDEINENLIFNTKTQRQKSFKQMNSQ